MAARRMHADELDTDLGLVRRLLAEQFPQWAELPLVPVESSGTVHALYRVGDRLVARLPRRETWAGSVAGDARWLPVLAPRVPFEVPVPLAVGRPGAGWPLPWGVYPWLEGSHPAEGAEDVRLARDLARVVRALRAIEPAGGEPPGRGVPLAEWDESVRRFLPQLEGTIDVARAARLWRACVELPEWRRPPVWLHGDLMPANLLLRGGRLAAVIDWGSMGLGDPACDLMVAWNLFGPAAREAFRAEVGTDEATWERGRGWALATGIAALPYYRETNPPLAANAAYRLAQVLCR